MTRRCYLLYHFTSTEKKLTCAGTGGNWFLAAGWSMLILWTSPFHELIFRCSNASRPVSGWEPAMGMNILEEDAAQRCTIYFAPLIFLEKPYEIVSWCGEYPQKMVSLVGTTCGNNISNNHGNPLSLAISLHFGCWDHGSDFCPACPNCCRPGRNAATPVRLNAATAPVAMLGPIGAMKFSKQT